MFNDTGNPESGTRIFMKEHVIRQIQAAEEHAEQKLQDARAQAEKILHDARRQAVETGAEIVNAARTNAKTVFEQGIRRFEPELDTLRTQFQDEITRDSTQAQKTFERVVEHVTSQFQQRVGKASD